ncbi:hypothetical protein B0J18DRAFT_137516 [Chaetomium sp. MPI-SDFR-AT-0129]|nr:hypothetical protein B0J18DRAFT_137516 [Chaetomium sp. MPI-SDFR-AT-0129]
MAPALRECSWASVRHFRKLLTYGYTVLLGETLAAVLTSLESVSLSLCSPKSSRTVKRNRISSAIPSRASHGGPGRVGGGQGLRRWRVWCVGRLNLENPPSPAL